jgi:hypothetical protein
LETVFALVCGIVAFVVGWILGHELAIGPASAVLIGLLEGAFCVGIYVLVSGWVGTVWPDLLDARVVGEHLIIVGLASPALGALGSLWGFRRARGMPLL